MHTISDTILSSLRLEATGVPIYVQLRDQVLRAIEAGVLNPGDQMPTMRQVAVALKIDLNTVRHAYDDLERAGAIILAQGRGSFIAPAGRLHQPANPTLEALARQAIATATSAGVDPIALAKRIRALAQFKESSS